jgi:serine/threonine-protein kinase
MPDSTRTAAPDARSSPVEPTRLGPAAPEALTNRYVLGEEIARGGMGVVYRAADTALGREVAVKVLLDSFAPASGTARRFHDEARITGQLQHPNIPAVHDLGTLPDGRPFLAMRLIKGDTLDALLTTRADPAADRGRFVAVFEQVCQAVAYAHAHNVIHRDLKPANVIVGAFGEVQVMDWGLAKVVGGRPDAGVDDGATAAGTAVVSIRETDGDVTQTGSVLGTPAFMPPEQAVGAVQKVGTRSDVFGLGAVLAVVLTGKPPFTAATRETARLRAATGDLTECFARLDGCGAGPELIALCKRCLSPRPEDRPADAGVVATAVAAFRAEAEDRAKRAEIERARAEVAAAEQHKRRKVQAAFGLAFTGLVMLGGAFAWWAQQQRLTKEAEQRERRAAVERDVNHAIEDVVAKAERARGAGHDLALWAEARATALQAESRAAEADAPQELRDRTRRLANEIQQAEKNRRLVATLADIQASMADEIDDLGNQDFAGGDAKYARAFREYGTDLLELAPEEGARLLQDLGRDIRVELATAIDDWGYVRFFLRGRRLDDTARHFRVTRLLDPDPMRNRVRDLVAARDYAGLKRLAEDIDPAIQPSQTVNLIAVYQYWFRGSDDLTAVIQFLLRAQPHHPSNFQVNKQLAFFLGKASRYEEAARYAQTAIALRPQSSSAWRHLALSLDELARHADALAAFRRAAALAPQSAYLRVCLGNSLQKNGDGEGALAAYREVVRLYQEAVRLNPNNAQGRNKLAWLLAAGPDGVRDAKQALEHATRACELTNWKDPNLIDTLAAAYAEAGEFDKAIQYQKQAVSFPGLEKPFSPEMQERLDHYTRKKPYYAPEFAPRQVGPPPREVKQ